MSSTSISCATPRARSRAALARQSAQPAYQQLHFDLYTEKITNAYCQRKGIATGSVRFMFDGELLNPNLTPEKLEMEQHDIIDVMLLQHGGGVNRPRW